MILSKKNYLQGKATHQCPTRLHREVGVS
jgi:hypothetical protein